MVVQIRKATPRDYAAFAALYPALGDFNPPPLLSRWEKEMMPTSFVAVERENNDDNNSQVVGYVWWTATVGSSEGQVKYIMVDAKHQRRGVGTALLRAVAKELQERHGCRRWRLYVKPENHPAVALYRKLGMERCFNAAEVHLTWDCVSRLPETEEGFQVVCQTVAPEEEASMEVAFALLPGVFREAREFGGRLPLQLRSSSDDGNKLLGCCIFDPAFPGAYPFCVSEPAYARRLLEEMYKNRREERDDFYLLIENQEALIEALVAAGAKVEFDLHCFSGSF